MKIYLLEKKSTSEQMREMLESLESYIKLAVDIEKKILAGGGILHADCEAVLLENGSNQENVWGADWLPFTQEVTFESLINIRPRQNNFGLEIEDEDLRSKIGKIVRNLMEGVDYE
ncbi:hypothetical protein BH20ACI4_BH20ACI4_00020 [soil metagenome]